MADMKNPIDLKAFEKRIAAIVHDAAQELQGTAETATREAATAMASIAGFPKSGTDLLAVAEVAEVCEVMMDGPWRVLTANFETETQGRGHGRFTLGNDAFPHDKPLRRPGFYRFFFLAVPVAPAPHGGK